MTPAKAKYVTYLRVSTVRQGRSGLGLEAQRAAVRAYLDAHAGSELATFTEVESGKTDKRPKLQAAIERCRQTRATLLIAKLDRLSRNAAFLLNLRDSGVFFQALDIPDANTLTLGVMALLAQQERELISTRTKAALQARRARGLPLGARRDLSAWQFSAAKKGAKANRLRAEARALELKGAIADARDDGKVTLRAIAEHLRSKEVQLPRGGYNWTPAAVARVVRYLDAQ